MTRCREQWQCNATGPYLESTRFRATSLCSAVTSRYTSYLLLQIVQCNERGRLVTLPALWSIRCFKNSSMIPCYSVSFIKNFQCACIVCNHSFQLWRAKDKAASSDCIVNSRSAYESSFDAYIFLFASISSFITSTMRKIAAHTRT